MRCNTCDFPHTKHIYYYFFFNLSFSLSNNLYLSTLLIAMLSFVPCVPLRSRSSLRLRRLPSTLFLSPRTTRFPARFPCLNLKSSLGAPSQPTKGNGAPTDTTTALLKTPPPKSPTSSLPQKPWAAFVEILQGVWQLSFPLWTSRRRTIALLWIAATVLFALGATLYAVLLSNVKKFFWNVISQKDVANFPKLLAVYGVTVALGPIVLGLFDWVKDRLSLVWRRALTERFLGAYFERLNYYKLSQGIGNIDNPDQRIEQDVAKFTKRAVRFLTVIGVAVFDLIIFSVVLYRIYSPLFYVLLGYAILGTLATVGVGRRLLLVNRLQAMMEADFRFGLVRVRESTENVAFYGGEEAERSELLHRFGSLFRNFISLAGLKRNVAFVSRSFQYWAQVLPTAVIAPQYFAGKIFMGTISQVYFSFNHVLGSVGLVVAEFAALAEFGAGVRRLKGFADVMKAGGATTNLDDVQIETLIEEEKGAQRIRIDGLTVETPSYPKRVLVRDLNIEVGKGESLLVAGRSGLGKSSLMRAVCGLWDTGAGRVTRPHSENTLFLPQRPFIMLGTLRENVIYPSRRENVTNAEVEDALRRANLGYLLQRGDGLDSSGEMLTRKLSLGEQQRLGFARIVISKPKVVVLDESTAALDEHNERDMYKMVKEMGTTVISVGNRPSLIKVHDRVLRLKEWGQWSVEIPERTRQDYT